MLEESLRERPARVGEQDLSSELQQELDEAYHRLAQLGANAAYAGRDLVRQERQSTALVVWRPRRG